jgi:hypothetical protein
MDQPILGFGFRILDCRQGQGQPRSDVERQRQPVSDAAGPIQNPKSKIAGKVKGDPPWTPPGPSPIRNPKSKIQNQPRRVPLRRRWNRRVLTDAQFLDERVEHRPLSPTCAGCAHLGEPIRTTDVRGARRFRRACPCQSLGFTDPDWPVCAHYQERAP